MDKADGIEVLLQRLFPRWECLDVAQKERLAAATVARVYHAGNHVHGGSNDCLGVLLVVRGTLRVFSLSEEGREITLFRVEAGQCCLLSAPCVLSMITFDVFIDAQTDVDLLVIQPACFQVVMQENSSLEAAAYRQMAERFSEVMWVMQQVLFVSFDKRLAAYLLSESRARSSAVLALTHESIARDLGSAREVVSRMLKYFEREGLVKLDRGSIAILDGPGLQAVTEA